MYNWERGHAVFLLFFLSEHLCAGDDVSPEKLETVGCVIWERKHQMSVKQNSVMLSEGHKTCHIPQYF